MLYEVITPADNGKRVPLPGPLRGCGAIPGPLRGWNPRALVRELPVGFGHRTCAGEQPVRSVRAVLRA